MDYTNAFTKGLFSSPGNNLMPPQYSTDMRNMRIDNGVMSVREGYRNIVRDNSFFGVSGLASNNGNLYAAINGHLKKIDFTTNTYTEIGALPDTNRMYPIVYDKYTILLSDGQPYVYDGVTLSPVTTYATGVGPAQFIGTGLNDMTTSGTNTSGPNTYAVKIDGTGATDTFKWYKNAVLQASLIPITNGVAQALSDGVYVTFAAKTGHTLGAEWDIATTRASNPRFGTFFSNSTFVAGGNVSPNSMRNVLYISRPIDATHPEYAYDWVGSGALQMVMDSDINALAATFARLFIFTENRISWLNVNSFTTVGGVSSVSSNPLANGEAVPNNGCVIVAGDKLFFLTKGKRIKSVNYVMGVDQVEIADISNTPQVGITKFLDDQLNDDLSQTVGFYDELNKHCKWFVRSRNSTVNDMVIIYDLVNQTFLIDDNKYYSCITRHSDGGFYAGCSLNTDIYQDEYGQDDDGGDISWYRYSAPLDNEKPWMNKVFYEVSTTGTIDSTTVIKKEIFVDNNSIYSTTISKPSPVLDMGTGSSPLGLNPVGENPRPESIIRFTKRIGREYLNPIGKFLQIKYSGSGVGQNFTLETIHTEEKVTNYREFDDV